MKARRTISAEVLLSPEYRKLSASAQSLYVYFILNADDYGFVKDTYKFVCTGGYKIDDLRPLYNGGFIIVFPDDVALIADWFRHTGTTFAMSPDYSAAYEYVYYSEERRFVEQNTLKEKRLSSKKQKVFIPPTLQEVKDYAASRNSVVDPLQFYNFFSTPNENGDTWVDANGKAVNNWKGKFVTWEKFKGGNNARNRNVASAQSTAGHSQTVSRFHVSYDIDGTAGES